MKRFVLLAGINIQLLIIIVIYKIFIIVKLIQWKI